MFVELSKLKLYACLQMHKLKVCVLYIQCQISTWLDSVSLLAIIYVSIALYFEILQSLQTIKYSNQSFVLSHRAEKLKGNN